MSASREKKQRRGDPEVGLTQKQRAELREKKAAKQKTILYTAIGVIIAILVVILLVWHSGIFQRAATALTVGGRTYNVNDVDYYFHTEMLKTYNNSYGSAFDIQGDLREQYVDEDQTQTYYDYFMDLAIQDLTQVAALETAADEAGFALSAEDEASVKEQIESLKNSAAQSGYADFSGYVKNFGKYMTVGAFENCMLREQRLNSFKQDYADKLDITDDAIQSYYDEHKDDLDSFNYRYIFVDGSAPSGTDADGNAVDPTEAETAAAMQAAKAKADEFAAAVKAADDKDATFAEQAPNYVSESSKDRYTEDPDYSLQSGVVGSDISAQTYGSWLLDASRTAGDVDVIEGSTGYYVVLFLDRYQDNTPTVDVRHILIKAELDQQDDASTTDVDESTVPSQDALDAAKAEAEELLTQWQAGDKTAESFGELANQYSDDPGSNENGGLYEKVAPGQMFDAFNDWLFDEARQPGDTTLIENTQSGQQGWHVVYYQGTEDPQWKNTADDALRTEGQNNWLTDLTKDLEATQGDGIKYVDN